MCNSDSLFRLDGKIALVTGAARGIGEECASMLAKAGAKVMLTDILEEDGQKSAQAICDAGGAAAFERHDVTSEADWVQVIAATIKRFGGLDIIVNNAGIEILKTVIDTDLEDWRKIQAVNSDGVFLGTKLAIKAMMPGGAAGEGGSIINMASAAGTVGLAGAAAYSATKGAVRLFTKSAALECGRMNFGIRVNSVHPGFIMTEMATIAVSRIAEMWFDGDVEATAKHCQDKTPIGHFGSTEDVAAAVVFLASDASKFITGTEIAVDGGLTAE